MSIRDDMSNCEACRNIASNSPEFIVHGVTSTVCDSLKEDTGLNPDLIPPQDNCEALQDLVDCYIGGALEKLPAVDLCDIKEEWLEPFMRGLYNLMSAKVCNECGQWDAIHELRRQNEEMRRILNTFLDHLTQIGVWNRDAEESETEINLGGSWQADRRLAGGNINLFGTASEADRFIRTNQTPNNPNDIQGGL